MKCLEKKKSMINADEPRFKPTHVSLVKGKVKCTLIQALRLCTGRTTHRGSRGIALLFLDHVTRRGWVVSVTPWQVFTPGKDTVTIVQEAGWAPGPLWTGAENVVPTGIRSPDRPARSRSLYRLRYPVHVLLLQFHKIWTRPQFFHGAVWFYSGFLYF